MAIRAGGMREGMDRLKIRAVMLRMVMAAALAAAGCSTAPTREEVLSEILKDIHENPPGPSAEAPPAHDTPDTPVSSLPPLSEQASAEAQDEQGHSEAKGGSLRIQPDSILQISVQEDPSLDGSYHVNEIGAVELGYVGPVILFNKTEKEAEKKIRDVLKGRDFKNATVKVRIVRASYDSVMVSGAVNKPGVIKIGAGDTIALNDALLRAGGLKPSATGARVKIVRNGLLSAVAASLEGEEYALVSEDGKPAVPDVDLRNNDVVFVYSTGAQAGVADGGEKEILVLGEVQKPGVYRFSAAEPCTMLHLALKLGGFPMYANKKAVKVLRRDKDGVEREIRVDVEKVLKDGSPAHDFPLENGDRVVVPARRISLF